MLIRVGLLTLVLAAIVVGLPHYGLARLVDGAERKMPRAPSPSST